jgi:hypothetical protein
MNGNFLNAMSRVLVLSLIGCSLAAMSGCHKKTEEDKVKEVITDIQAASEAKDIGKIVKSISKTYHDPRGNDYNSIKAALLGYFFRHRKIHVYLTNMEVSVQGASAKAAFQAVFSGGKSGSGGMLPEELGVYSFEVSFLKESGRWMVASANWKRSGRGEEGGEE